MTQQTCFLDLRLTLALLPLRPSEICPVNEPHQLVFMQVISVRNNGSWLHQSPNGCFYALLFTPLTTQTLSRGATPSVNATSCPWWNLIQLFWEQSWQDGVMLTVWFKNSRLRHVESRRSNSAPEIKRCGDTATFLFWRSNKSNKWKTRASLICGTS